MVAGGNIKIKDVLWAMNVIGKIVEFSEEVGKLIRFLNKNMIDVRNLNPSNFEDILKLAMSLYEEEEVDIDLDLENLKKMYDEILEWDITTIDKAVSIMNTYMATMNNVKNTVRRASQDIFMSRDEIQFVRNMMSIPKVSVERNEGNVVITELTAEDLAKIRDVIKALKE